MSENKKSTAGTEETDPAATMGLQMYRDLNMSSDAVIHLMPRVHDERIKNRHERRPVLLRKNSREGQKHSDRTAA